MKFSNKHLNYIAKGFTLVELLVVIAIIATLGGLSYGPIMEQIRFANVTKATKVCNDLSLAISNFELEFGSLPSGAPMYPTVDTLVETNGSQFLDVIMGFDTTNNDKGKQYFEADQSDSQGTIIVNNNATLLGILKPLLFSHQEEMVYLTTLKTLLHSKL